jgi:hypothetical protein
VIGEDTTSKGFSVYSTSAAGADRAQWKTLYSVESSTYLFGSSALIGRYYVIKHLESAIEQVTVVNFVNK